MTLAKIDAQSLAAVRRHARRHVAARDRERLARAQLQAAIVLARRDGHTLVAIGRIMGISPQRVSQIAEAAD